ncbi:MAG: hypothetical protein U9Q73_00365 [Nanoarchaeota archaeon]|nr:hypothetical protein [Nanoarchaeota archaeon]
MEKKNIIAIICVLFSVGIISIFLIFSSFGEVNDTIINDTIINDTIVEDVCLLDSDCVPASCCHSIGCVIKEKAPDCAETLCSWDCSGPLDCGAGYCGCVDNKCEVVSN